MTQKLFLWHFCSFTKSPLSKKSRFLAEYKRTRLWKLCFVPQRKEKTKVETSSNSKNYCQLFLWILLMNLSIQTCYLIDVVIFVDRVVLLLLPPTSHVHDLYTLLVAVLCTPFFLTRPSCTPDDQK